MQAREQRKAAHAAWGATRRTNALARDFTVNGLLYDPFDRILYDYVGGFEGWMPTQLDTPRLVKGCAQLYAVISCCV